MESTIVIKVKYGETLRRFNARVNEAGQLDLDIVGLREKVLRLFNLALDVDLTLTYIDEDGDEVTLVDKEDLCDVMRQSLDPLRITVKLNAEMGTRFYARSSGNSTPMRSSRFQNPLPKLNSSVSEILKSVPEPLHEALSKLFLDLTSKAAYSSPVLAELVDGFSKMGQTYLNQVSEFQTGKESSTQTGASESAMGASMIDEPQDGATSEVIPNYKFEEPTTKTNQKLDRVNSTRGVDALNTPGSGSLNPNVDLPGDSFPLGSVSVNLAPVAPQDAVGDSDETKKFSVPSNNKKVVKTSGEGWNSVSTGVSPSSGDTVKNSTVDSAANLARSKSTKSPVFNLVNECPFSGIQVANDAAMAATHFGSRVHPFKRSYNHSDGMNGVFHRGVRCDGCGVHPITGPRFKSKVNEDYDLCSICFSEIGNGADYIRINRPASWRRPYSLKGLYDPQPRVHPPTRPDVLTPEILKSFMMNTSHPKLDSVFIMDVNVLDGTIMAPSTPFTKIWRMRNNGTIVWPQGTQLVWIGGEKLSAPLSVELQIGVDGLPEEKELDVAIDFRTPELPGRYISYWKMSSPSGQKFGQRIWVLVQVDTSLKDSLCDSVQGFNLNLPPVGSGITGPETINVNAEPIMVEGSLPKLDISDERTKLLQELVDAFDARPTKNLEPKFTLNHTLLVGDGVSNIFPSEVPRSVMLPITQIAPPVPSRVPSSSTVVPMSFQGVREDNDVEQALLRDLADMGFKQVDLNKEILRLNEYNMEQSLDDLCGVAEWDPILDDLQEMGFRDKEMNKRLLKKNKGSIKRVVMDLITGEKAG